jgi:hypothetical protein
MKCEPWTEIAGFAEDEEMVELIFESLRPERCREEGGKEETERERAHGCLLGIARPPN